MSFLRFLFFKPLIVIAAIALCGIALESTALAASEFSPPARVGFAVGDQWEPAVAADGYGDVYVLYPQYGVVPGCAHCANPTMVLTLSTNNGKKWQPPRPIHVAGSAQFDAQIVVDPANRRSVYAAWLQNERRDAVLARSDDFGTTWSVAVAARMSSAVDKPVLAVRGADVYIAFSHAHKLAVVASHDGGSVFNSTLVNPESKLGWSLAGGGVVDPAGNIYFSWAEYIPYRVGKLAVNLYVSKSDDRGQTWSNSLLDRSASPPSCSAYKCEWGHLGAQIALASDAAGTLYALWNSGPVNGAPERIYFSSSTTAGDSWLAKSDVSAAPQGVEHCFPALTAGATGDVRIAWMDTRNAGYWNTLYRSSSNGGVTWSSEEQLSGYAPGYSYVSRRGFSFPFGDYFGMAIDSVGDTQAVWGEGLNFQSPGSIWYSRGR